MLSSSFVRFFLVGGLMGVATVGARELIGYLLPGSPLFYVISILLTYAIAITVSFALHARYTFASKDGLRRAQLARYALISIASAIAGAWLAYVFCFPLGFEVLLMPYGRAVSFAVAAIVVAIGSYFVNRKWVFR